MRMAEEGIATAPERLLLIALRPLYLFPIEISAKCGVGSPPRCAHGSLAGDGW
jgi:hypothetical protein